MKAQKIEEARAMAVEFVKRVDALEAQRRAWYDGGCKYYFNHPKEQGAVRRVSMDLTRALADMRKPG